MDIVEVTAHFFKKGDVITYEDYEEDYLFEKPLDETVDNYEHIHDNSEWDFSKGDSQFHENNIGFSFRWVGEFRSSCKEYGGTAVDYLVENCGVEETFQDDLEYFVEIANRKLNPEPKKFKSLSEALLELENSKKEITHLSFLLQYSYRSWRDDFTGEYDEEFECKGELKLK